MTTEKMLPLLLLLLPINALASEGEMEICHLPPGLQGEEISLRIDASAWPAHAAHGDVQGPCALRRFEGHPHELLLDVVQDFDTGRAAPAATVEQEPEGAFVVRPEIGIHFAHDATLQEVNRFLRRYRARVVNSLERRPLIVVHVPDPGTLAAVDELVAKMISDPVVLDARRGVLPSPAALPEPYRSAPGSIQMEKIDHHVAVRAHAAWNAARLYSIADLRDENPVLIVADYFGADAPDSDYALDVLNEQDFAESRHPSLADEAGGHGYHVLGIIAAAHGGDADERALATGLLPDSIDLRVIDLEKGFGDDRVDALIVQRVQEAIADGRRAVVNTSLGNNCEDDVRYCNPEAIAAQARDWIVRVRGIPPTDALESRFVHVTANGNLGATGVRDPEKSSHWSAARLRDDLSLFGRERLDPLGNTIVVSDGIHSPNSPFRFDCLSESSWLGGDLTAIGTDVYSLLAGEGAADDSGTSMATPQAAAAAAYLWAVRPEERSFGIVERLLAAPQAPTLERDSSECDATAVPAAPLDAFAALLRLDRPEAMRASGSRLEDAPVRMAVLDVANRSGDPGADSAFDHRDLRLHLSGLSAGGGGALFDRHDLNGDGFTGGAERSRFDLDIDGAFEPSVTRDVAGRPTAFDERAVTDLDVLCYYAYSPLYSGDPPEDHGLRCSSGCEDEPFVVNETTAGDQGRSHVATAPDDSIAVAWTTGAFGSRDVMARIYEPDGSPRTGEFRLSDSAANERTFVRIAWTSANELVAVFKVYPSNELHWRRFSRSGTPLGGDGVVQPTAGARIANWAVAADRDGGWIVAWRDIPAAGDETIQLRFYGAGGTGSAAVQVNSDGSRWFSSVEAAVAPNGNVLVTWQRPTERSIRARLFSSGGAPLSPEREVNAAGTGLHEDPRIGVTGAGDFAVVWKTSHHGSDRGIRARRVLAADASMPDPDRFVIHEYGAGKARVVSDPGGFLVGFGYNGSRLWTRRMNEDATPAEPMEELWAPSTFFYGLFDWLAKGQTLVLSTDTGADGDGMGVEVHLICE